ncbi:MAG: uracil-DNA glycosylase [Desulfobacterales bacterium]|nr:uracil-DNA glycosylase [Desulfobacterales bacterium]
MTQPRQYKTVTKKEMARHLINEAENTLRNLSQMGHKGFDCPESHLEIIETWGKGIIRKTQTLDEISAELGDCRRCKLSKQRTNIVFGAGSANARLFFVGEGPGHDEDIQGVPFVGRAGQLLTKIIEAIKLTRDDVYIGNIIKCRPPKNRNPESDEITACSPFLQKQITAIKPDIICALGTFAAQTLLKSNTPISRMRGKFHNYNGIKVMPTYHPAYLLRSPEKKRDVWEDMKLIMKELGL